MANPLRRPLDWLQDRTGYRGAINWFLDEPVRGGASWMYIFGSVLVFILIQQAVTGVALAMYYSPSATDAWASVAYIEDGVSMGWFIRGLHNHGASAMVIVAGLHLMQTAVYGAYKKPREVNWLIGVIMLGLILAFALTGYLLPWDQKGYWATKVATGIMGSTPVIGGWLKRFVQGGNEYGNLTLTRFYAIHVFILPATLFLLVAIHIVLFRRHGVTPKWGKSDAELDRATQPFWPDQLFKDMVAILITFVIISWLAWRNHGVGLEAPADPASQYDARPEWYFLPLFQLLKYFTGTMETVAALGVPALAGIVLFSLPFVDRGPDRAPLKRLPYLATIGVGLLATAALLIMAKQDDSSDDALKKRQAAAEVKGRKARELAREGVPPAGGTAVFENDPAYQGQKIFAEKCAGCHVGEERKGPELIAGYNTRQWIREFVKDPDGPRFYGPTKDIHKMKPAKLEGADLDAVVELIYSQQGAPDANAALVAKGQELFDNGPCSDCHSIDWVTEGEEGPNLGKRGSREWLIAFVVDPAHPRFFGELNEMPAFGPKLTPEQIERVVDYVISLRLAPAGGEAGP
jgi:ubiquinol-cytochrome c reductase cytochrome b subunit